MELAEERSQDRFAVEVRERRIAEGVERPDVGRARMPQDRQGQGRHHRLVQVNQVELLLLEQALGLQIRAQRQGDASHRAVGGNRDDAADAMHGRVERNEGLCLVVRRGRHDVYLVAPRGELFSQMGDMLSDAARVGKVVGRDEGELHRLPLLTRAAPGASASGRRSIAPDGCRHSTPGVWQQPELAGAHRVSHRLYLAVAAAAR